MDKINCRKTLQHFAFLCLLIWPFPVFGLDKETLKAMPFVSDRKYCLRCHQKDEDKKRFDNLTMACDKCCVQCHDGMEKHHSVGMVIEEKNKPNLPLTGSGRLNCVTCHDLKIRKYDSRCWKSQSLFDRVFARKDKYRTYYLRINNHDGKLCRICH